MLFDSLQGQAKEELQKSRSKVEELNEAKKGAEKNISRLTSDLKTFREKSEKVSGPSCKWQTVNKYENILQIVLNFHVQ